MSARTVAQPTSILCELSPDGTVADGVIRLLRDSDHRDSIDTAAREFIVQNRTWEKHSSDLEQTLVDIAGREPAIATALTPIEQPAI